MSIAAYQGVCPTCRHDHSEPVTALASSGDHAELENAGHIVWWKAGGVSYFPEGESFTLSASCRVEPLVTAASASALLAENAALRARLETARFARVEHNRQFEEMRTRATEAERKLAEAVGLMRESIEEHRHMTDVEAFEELGLAEATELVAIRTFLSKEAERG